MVCAFKTMRTIRFCAVLMAVCAVFALGVAVGGAGQRYQLVTHSGQAAGISHRLDRWTGETWVCMPAVHPGSRWQWHPMPVAGYPWEAAQPVAAQPVPPALPQPSGNVQFLPTPPPMDGAIRIQNGHSYRYNAQTQQWE